MRADAANRAKISNEAMSMQNILKMSAADLGQSIAVGRLDPTEITQAYLDAAQNHSEMGLFVPGLNHTNLIKKFKVFVS